MKPTKTSSSLARRFTLPLTLLLLTSFAFPSMSFGQASRGAGQQRQGVLGQRNANAKGGAANARNAAAPKAAAPAVPAAQPAPQGGKPAVNVAGSQKESCVLKSSHKAGAADVVEVTLEASGEALQTNQEGKTDRSEMEVVAGFKYEERYDRYSPTGAIRTYRRYEQAGVKRKLGANVVRSLLDSSRKFVVSEYDGKKTRVYSAAGPMKDEQYALINELPFNTILLDRLLPNREVKLGEDWTIPNDLVVAAFGVDAIENNTLHLTLTSIADDVAEIELYQVGEKDAQGAETPSTLVCASEGASIGLDLEGKFQFDLTTNRITWFGLHIDERRSESVATPGLKWSATFKVTIAPLAEPEKLTDDVVAPLAGEPKPEQLLLYYNGQKGPWKFQHSRRWKLIEDAEKTTSLCYLDGGEAIAQCNILSNGKIDLATKPSLAGYKDEIKKGLGERFAEFKQEAEYEGVDEVSVYYVVADGSYDELPFRWIYYLVTDKDGNQATIMFELRADFLDKYDDSGNEIVESFRLRDRNAAGVREDLENAAANGATGVPAK